MNRVHIPPRPSDREQLPSWYATVLAAQKSSGLTMADFIVETGISNSSLYKWRQRLISEAGDTPQKPMATEFIEVKLARHASSGAGHMTVRIAGNHHGIEVPRDFDGEALRRLVEVLESC
jgi:hypothetical protein